MTADLLLTILSCIGFMGLVAFVSWRQTRGRVDTGTGYFLAGRGWAPPLLLARYCPRISLRNSLLVSMGQPMATT